MESENLIQKHDDDRNSNSNKNTTMLFIGSVDLLNLTPEQATIVAKNAMILNKAIMDEIKKQNNPTPPPTPVVPK